MPSKYFDVMKSEIPANKLARVLMTTLRRHQWRVEYVDEETGIITADQKSQEKIMGRVWSYNYNVVIRWDTADGALASPEVEVNERSYDWTYEDCKKKFDEIASALVEDSRQIMKVQDKPTKGARWATPKELAKAGYVTETKDPRRFLITGDGNNYLSMPEPETNRHALIIGPTGSGKTTGIHIPNLIERTDCSALVTEATGGKGVADLYNKTVGYRAAHGHRIVYFNTDYLGSDRFNPLDFVETYRDARRVVEIIMQSTTLATHRGDQSWEMSERVLLTGLILHAVGIRDEGKANLGHIADLFEDGPEGIQKVVSESPIEAARIAYKKFLNTTTSPYRNLVANGIITRLDLWNEPRIRALTETTDIDLDELQNELFTWYLATPADKPELKPLAALIFNFALSFVTTKELKHPVALFLDEFTNFGYVRGLPNKMSIIRHDKIPVVLGVQDFGQLEDLYKHEAKHFFTQTAVKLFFKPNDPETAKQISLMLGTALVNEGKVTSSGHLKDVKEKEPLLSVDDLLNLGAIDERMEEVEEGKPNMIVFLPSTRPVQVRALTWKDYVNQTNPALYPIPERRILEVDETLVRSQPKTKKTDATKQKVEEEEDAAATSDEDEESVEDDASEKDYGFLQW